MFKRLAELLKIRKGKYILFLGAGASVSSGGKTTQEIIEDIAERFELDPKNPWDSFYDFLKNTGVDERFAILSRYFEDMKPSSGYEILARLIEEKYFRLILTTNFDFMLEEALKKTKLVLNRDYFVCVVGVEKENILVRQLEDESMVRIVKLHGDYKTKILPFTEEETFRFGKELEEYLKRLTKEGIIFLGYSGMDRDVLSCLSHEGEPVWWVNPRKITSSKNIVEKNPVEYTLNEDVHKVMTDRKSHKNFFWKEDGKSDIFFEKISEEIFKRDINSFCDLLRFGATRYRKMKDLFEPPYQYEEMKKKLEEYGVLLILGEPHLGKTYTALNLLYDYYVEGFDVSFISELNRKETQRKITYHLEELLEPGMVIYLEDLFGKTEPENTQIFKSELKRIIERIQSSKSMVIITSRLNIFKEVGDPREFPMIMELMKKDISYDLEKRKRIIDRYLAVYKPAWRELMNKKIAKVILKAIIARELTEPHNIDMLFEKSLNINSMMLLFEKIEESKEILAVFREEIEMSSIVEKIFFYVCYFFWAGWGRLEYAKNSFISVMNSFDLDLYKYDFDKLLKKYDFRVETYEQLQELRIKFSHPDFSKAVEESIKKNIWISLEILAVITESKDKHVRGLAAKIVGANFETLPDRCRKLLLILAKDKEDYVRGTIASVVASNVDKLSDEFRKLLFKLVKDKSADVREEVADAIVLNFENLPEEYRKLLFKLSKDRNADVREGAALIVGCDFENLPEEYRRLLFKLAKDRNADVRGGVAYAVSGNFENLPEEYRKLLFKLAKDRNADVRGGVASAVADDFENLPEEYRRLLFKLAKDRNADVRATLVRIIAYKFKKLPHEYRMLLLGLAEDKNSRVKEAIFWNERELPNEFGHLLCELTRDEKIFYLGKKEIYTGSLATTIVRNFEKLPDECRKLLFRLSKDKSADVRADVAKAIGYSLEWLPEEYRKLLLKLSKDRNADVRADVAGIIADNFVKLSEEYRRLLFDLARDRHADIRGWVAENIGYNFEKLPEEYRKLLFDLAEDKNVYVRGAVAFFICEKYEKIPLEYQRILEKLKLDTAVQNLLRKWIKDNEEYKGERERIKTIKHVFNL